MKIHQSINGFLVTVFYEKLEYTFYLDAENYEILMLWLESDYNHIEIGNKNVLILDQVVSIEKGED